MNLFQFSFFASCLKIIVLASPSEDRGKLGINKKYSEKYFRKRYLTFEGHIKVVGDAKIFGISCFPNTKIKHEDGRLFIDAWIIACRHFFLRWSPDLRSHDADKFYTLAEASFNDKKSKGTCNAKWESTASIKEMPNSFKSALESRNVAEMVTSDRFKSYMNIFFILHRCDPLPGKFLCENAVKAHYVSPDEVALLSDFYKPSDEEASPKCPNYKDESRFYKMQNKLIEEYNENMKESFNFEDFGRAKVSYTDVDGSGKRKINIRCSVNPDFVKHTKSVSAFFIFYQPLGNIRQARSLLVGFTDNMLWTDPYRIRMIPQLKHLLKDKDASCNVGDASKAEMKVNIVLDECDILSGGFQCAIVAEVTKRHKMHKDASVKFEILRAMYKLTDTAAAKPGSGCKSAKADSSVSLTASVKARKTKKGKSAGYRITQDDNLVAEYSLKMQESFNIEDFGMAKVVYRDIKGSGKRKINIECRLSPKMIKNVKKVSALFIFYQPLSNVPQARHLLVGFSQDMLWTQPYRIRMFPQFKTMLRDKNATSAADKANIAHIKLNIVLNECDALSGGFQCAIVAEVIKRHKGHTDGSVKFEVLRGMYNLKDTSASKPSPKCKSRSDASYTLTAALKASPTKKGRSTGCRIQPGVSLILTVGVIVLLL